MGFDRPGALSRSSLPLTTLEAENPEFLMLPYERTQRDHPPMNDHENNDKEYLHFSVCVCVCVKS